MAETQQTMTEFTFAPGEKNIIGDRFSPSVIIFWLKTSIAASSTFLVFLLIAAAFAFAQTAPDAETLIVFDGPLQALLAHLAAGAHLFRITRRPAFFGEKSFRIGLGAQGLMLPGNIVVRLEQAPQLTHRILGGIVDHSPHVSLLLADAAMDVHQGNYTHATYLCQVYPVSMQRRRAKVW